MEGLLRETGSRIPFGNYQERSMVEVSYFSQGRNFDTILTVELVI